MSISDKTKIQTSRAGQTEPDSIQAPGTKPTRWQRLVEFLDQRSLRIPFYAGVAAFFILPVGVIVLRVAACGYGLDTDYSGVPLCLTPFLIAAAGTSALAGALGLGIGRLLENRAVRRSALIGTVLGSLLAIAAALAISVFPAGMLMFPDC